MDVRQLQRQRRRFAIVLAVFLGWIAMLAGLAWTSSAVPPSADRDSAVKSPPR